MEYHSIMSRASVMYRLMFAGCVLLIFVSVALTCEDNEKSVDCAKNCTDDYCPTSNDQTNTCTESDTCEAGCKCGFNYRRATNGTCIPTRDCPAFDCPGENEEYNPCPPICPNDSCKQATPTGRCPYPGRIGIVLECKPTCRCIKNYWRKNGVCVPYAECGNSD